MSLKDDIKVLDRWYDAEPEEAAKFAVALQRRYSALESQEARLRQFAIEAPDKFRDMMTSLGAQYTPTGADIERAVGRQAIAQIRNANGNG